VTKNQNNIKGNRKNDMTWGSKKQELYFSKSCHFCDFLLYYFDFCHQEHVKNNFNMETI